MFCYYCSKNTHTTQDCIEFKRPDFDEAGMYQATIKHPEFNPEKNTGDRLIQLLGEENLWESTGFEEKRKVILGQLNDKLEQFTDEKKKDIIKEIHSDFAGKTITENKEYNKETEINPNNKYHDYDIKVIPYLASLNETFQDKLINLYLAKDNRTVIYINVMIE